MLTSLCLPPAFFPSVKFFSPGSPAFWQKYICSSVSSKLCFFFLEALNFQKGLPCHKCQLCLLKPLLLLAGSKRKPLGTPCYQITLLEPDSLAWYFQKVSLKNPLIFTKIHLCFKNCMPIEVAILKLPRYARIKSPFPTDCSRYPLREGGAEINK